MYHRGDYCNDLYEEITDHIHLNGLHTSPHNIQIIIDSEKNMNDALIRAWKKTKVVIKHLRQDNVKICHPYIRDKNVFNNIFPECVTILVSEKNSWEMLTDEMKKIVIEFKTSYGGPMSRLDPYPVKFGNFIAIRVSIGYNDEPIRVIFELMDMLKRLE